MVKKINLIDAIDEVEKKMMSLAIKKTEIEIS